ncbi:hypothetical protein BC937DRAFT_91610 [Endogone sp. FLAS-F59071]|nr:hypothetical protein BC937DRAFT_91610 [Endogone sp. FLAS-F59071]|eukprot:RUS16105.1 hypothetical protein BC937DRAFT_91610 [Endogone sp. FLAS-F59071]
MLREEVGRSADNVLNWNCSLVTSARLHHQKFSAQQARHPRLVLMRLTSFRFKNTPISIFIRPFSSSSPILARMPPKKAVKEEKILLGRPSNNLKIGVVGLPNVG